MKCSHTNQHIPLHTNMSLGGNRSSPSCTPFHEHKITSTPIQWTAPFTLTRLCGGSHETATASTRYGSTHTMHHTTGEWSPSCYGSHGRQHGQAIQLQTINEKCETQTSMEPVISQQIWTISKWHWRQDTKSHQHNWVHLPTWSTNRTDERCHIWTIRVHSATRKGRTQSNAFHCRGRQNQLPWQSCHPDHGNAGGKNAIQQRNLHKWCTLHDNGHIQLLPYDTITPSQIHPCETKQHTWWSNWRI